MVKKMLLVLVGLLLVGGLAEEAEEAEGAEAPDLTGLCDGRYGNFQIFAHRCKKDYQSNSHRADAHSIFDGFCRNLQAMKQNKKIDFQVELNCYADNDLSITNPKIKFPPSANTRELPKENRITKLTASLGASLGVSSATNWRTKGFVTTPKNQGSCGSCWAHATAACYESALLRALSITVDLSEEWILECTDVYNATRNPKSSCQGGVIDFALPMMVATGIPKESTYPYVAGSYSGATHPGSIANCFAPTNYEVLKYSNGSLAQWYRYNNVTAAQIQSLLGSGTLVIAFYVEATFQAYRGGVYSSPVNFATAYGLINHAMELVGMDANGNYVVKNSWGTSWGDGGFATIDPNMDGGLTAYVYQLLWGQFHAISMLLLSLVVFLAI